MLRELNTLIYSFNTYLLDAYFVAAFGDACRKPCPPAPMASMGPLSELPWMVCFYVSTFGFTSWTANSMSPTGMIIFIISVYEKFGVETSFLPAVPCVQGLFITYLST